MDILFLLDHLSYFHFVGRIIGEYWYTIADDEYLKMKTLVNLFFYKWLGMAIFHGHHIDGGFTTPFYKMLLNKTISLVDIESVDPDLHSSLSWLLHNDISGGEIIDTTFSVSINNVIIS